MAIQLTAAEVHIVLTALWEYRKTLTIVNDTAPNPSISEKIEQVETVLRAIKAGVMS